MMSLKITAPCAAGVFAALAMGAASCSAAHAVEASTSKVLVRWSAFTPRVLSSTTSSATRLVAAKARLQGQLQTVVPGSWVGRSFEHVGWSVVAIPANQKTTAFKRLQSTFGATNVETIHSRRLYKTPNDPEYGSQWWLDRIGAPAAWNTTTGSSSVIVAVVDSGAALSHPDLAGNIWKNTGEIAGNGVDDDKNGYVDDVNGYNAIDLGKPPEDDSFHGTHVAGIIGAVGNNSRDVTGVNWNVKIIPVKVFDASNLSDDPTIIQGIDYILALKAKGVNIRTINHSWGGKDDSQALQDAFARLDRAGILSVVAAGNDGNNIDPTDPNKPRDYPSAYTFPTILSVGGTNFDDEPTYNSNYGARSVDIFAPGEDIVSLWGRDSIAYLDGTSMATPMVAGAAALLLSLKPTSTAAQLKATLLNTADKLPQLTGKCVSNGRLNLAAAIALVSPTPTPTPTPTATPKPTPTPTPKPTATPTPVPPVVTVVAPAVYEGNSGTTAMKYTLSLSKASAQPVTVVVQSANAATSSATAGSDYLPLGKTRVTFAPGQRSQTVALSIVGDTTYEENERVALLLSSPVGATIKNTTAEGVIVNDDSVPSLSINDVGVVEGNRNYTKATFTVSLSNPSYRPISVGYNTYSSGRGAALGGTATTTNVDYIAIAPTTLTFLAGQTSKIITVLVKADTVVEGNEIFGVRVAAPVNARIADGIGVGTIQNDDNSPKSVQSNSTGSGGNS